MSDMLAEQVLLSVLDARPVAVDDIRAAIDGLHEPTPPAEPNRIQIHILNLERIAAQAAEVVEAHDANKQALLEDRDPDHDRVWDSINALKPLLAEIARA